MFVRGRTCLKAPGRVVTYQLGRVSLPAAACLPASGVRNSHNGNTKTPWWIINSLASKHSTIQQLTQSDLEKTTNKKLTCLFVVVWCQDIVWPDELIRTSK